MKRLKYKRKSTTAKRSILKQTLKHFIIKSF